MRDNTKAFGFSNDNPWNETPAEMIRLIAEEYNLPLIEGFPAGHIADNRAFYLERTCSIKTGPDSAEIEFF